MTLHTIPVSQAIYERLLQQAKQTKRPLADIVQQTLDRNLPETIALEETLPPLLRAELEAMAQLSDSALVALASSTMTTVDQFELNRLNDLARERVLSEQESTQQDALLNQYDEVVLRRAHAAVLLKSRGFDVSDPSQFHPK